MPSDKKNSRVFSVSKTNKCFIMAPSITFIIIFQVQIPPYAPVAVWKIIVHTARKGVAGVNQHEILTPIYVLFNPWCPSKF